MSKGIETPNYKMEMLQCLLFWEGLSVHKHQPIMPPGTEKEPLLKCSKFKMSCLEPTSVLIFFVRRSRVPKLS